MFNFKIHAKKGRGCRFRKLKINSEKVLKLDIVKQWVVMVLTCKVSFAAVDAVSGLKLLDAGVPKEKMALLAVPLTPIQIVLPIFLAPFTTGAEPLNLWIRSYFPRLFMGGVITALVYYTPIILQVICSYSFLKYF